MRLIDADEFLKEIVKRCGCIHCVESRKGETIYLNNLISEQPTAYDVDKVIEKLKFDGVTVDIPFHCHQCPYEKICNEVQKDYEGELCTAVINKIAFDIVRTGGFKETIA